MKKSKMKENKNNSKVVKALKPMSNNYQKALSDIKRLVQQARYASSRSVNAIMTATYWEIGRRIVQVEQKGKQRAGYGERLIQKLAKDLVKSCGKGFSFRNLTNCRKFYLLYSKIKKVQTLSALLKATQKTKKALNFKKTYFEQEKELKQVKVLKKYIRKKQ